VNNCLIENIRGIRYDQYTTRVPGYPGSFEQKLSISRVVKIRVFWTHYPQHLGFVSSVMRFWEVFNFKIGMLFYASKEKN